MEIGEPRILITDPDDHLIRLRAHDVSLTVARSDLRMALNVLDSGSERGTT